MSFAHLAIDCHLHFYPFYNETIFFDSLCFNLNSGCVTNTGDLDQLERIGILTEGSGTNTFSRWSGANIPDSSGYTFTRTNEPYSLALNFKGKRRALIIAGKQIITSERIEVLTAGAGRNIPDGQPLADVVSRLSDAAELVILPWGAGKWLGRRGRLIEKLVKTRKEPFLFLADNPARPKWWPAPRSFGIFSARGGTILRGSDPLPLPGEEKRAGGFATLITGEFDPALPLSSLKAILAGSTATKDIGQRDGFFTFFQRQLRLRLQKNSLAGAKRQS
jgi:hypothetical protein